MGAMPGAIDYRGQHDAIREQQRASLSREWAGEVAEKILALVNGRVQPPSRDEIVEIIMSRKDLQKQHDGGSSITQANAKPTGSPGKPYTSGANVGSGKGPSPSKPAIAAGPKSGTEGR
jgi:hypothetical protein